MKFFDISLAIKPGMVVWPGDPEVILERISSLDRGDFTNVSRLSLCTHAGTHVDASLHLLVGGADAASLPLNTLVGEAEVWDLTAVEGIVEPGHLTGRRLPARLLLKTRNSALWQGQTFSREFVALGEAAARFLAEGGVRLIGVDYLSVDAYSNRDLPVHRTLLAAGIVALEGLNLSEVPAGAYRLVCLPLPLVGADGAPARAVLLADG